MTDHGASKTDAGLKNIAGAGPACAGQVVYLYAFDLAYDIEGKPIRELLGQPVVDFSVDTDKRSPRYLFLHHPKMVRLPAVERIGPQGPVRLERTVKIYPLGAISIAVKVPFSVPKIEDLVRYHDLAFATGELYSEVKQLAEDIRLEMKSHFIRPVARLEDEEAYTVFCVNAPLAAEDGGKINAEGWLSQHRRAIASLLTQEPDPGKLSHQEAQESSGKFLSYYEDDLVVVDWDAALIVDDPKDFDETLHVLELVNLQLAELESYDRLLDAALERSYKDLSGPGIRSSASLMRELREIRIDLARFSDELPNITKFIGDWHLARICQTASERFHLSEWHHSIDEKLKTLDDLYQLLAQDRNNHWMLLLEVTIVLLFIIDLVMLFFGLGKP